MAKRPDPATSIPRPCGARADPEDAGGQLLNTRTGI
jgi:hypothetical protein